MAVSILGATKRFGGDTAVSGVDLELAPAEFVAIVGPSGCGKSTLLRLVAGLEALDAGEIRIAGRAVAGPGLHAAPEDRGVGVVFQSYALWPHLSVRDNVAFPLEAAGARRQAARDAAETHLGTMRLSGFGDRRPAELSGGQRQRVALARCVAQGAGLILMDEPLANLDPHLRAGMEEELAAFHRRTRTAVLYITHDQREAFAMADRVAVMQAGTILQCDPPEAVYETPRSIEVARFIGRGAILPARRTGDEADLGPLRIPVEGPAAGPDIAVMIRPDRVEAAPGAPVPGIVTGALYRGGAWEADVRVEGLAETLPVTVRRRIAPGDAVRIAISGGWALPVSRARG